MKFGKLILRKIIKIVATTCHILKLKCTKFDFGWGLAPCRPYWGNLQRSPSPDPLAGFKDLPSNGREGMKDGMEGQGSGRRGPTSKTRGKGLKTGGEGVIYPVCEL